METDELNYQEVKHTKYFFFKKHILSNLYFEGNLFLKIKNDLPRQARTTTGEHQSLQILVSKLAHLENWRCATYKLNISRK